MEQVKDYLAACSTLVLALESFIVEFIDPFLSTFGLLAGLWFLHQRIKLTKLEQKKKRIEIEQLHQKAESESIKQVN